MYSLLGIFAVELAVRFFVLPAIPADLTAALFLALGIAVVEAAKEDIHSRFFGLVGLLFAMIMAVVRLPAWLAVLGALDAATFTQTALAMTYLVFLPLGLLALPLLAGLERAGYWRWRPWQ